MAFRIRFAICDRSYRWMNGVWWAFVGVERSSRARGGLIVVATTSECAANSGGVLIPGWDTTHAIHGVRPVLFQDDPTGGQSSWRMDDKPTVGGRDAAFELQGCIYCVSAFRHAAATRRALILGRDTTHASMAFALRAAFRRPNRLSCRFVEPTRILTLP